MQHGEADEKHEDARSDLVERLWPHISEAASGDANRLVHHRGQHRDRAERGNQGHRSCSRDPVEARHRNTRGYSHQEAQASDASQELPASLWPARNVMSQEHREPEVRRCRENDAERYHLGEVAVCIQRKTACRDHKPDSRDQSRDESCSSERAHLYTKRARRPSFLPEVRHRDGAEREAISPPANATRQTARSSTYSAARLDGTIAR